MWRVNKRTRKDEDYINYKEPLNAATNEIRQSKRSYEQKLACNIKMTARMFKHISGATHKYSLFGQPLSTVSSHSYLGVKLDSKLTWTNHVTDITSKSSKVLVLIKRTHGPCKSEIKQTAYNMLIRPKLEYSSPIWNPHTISQVKSLERVQHSAARFVKIYYRRNTNPADLITALGWPTFERRRIIKQATTFYKIINNIIEITSPQAY